ncbi:hypothetical protein VAPA_1c49100 [Variovorax paradoxus B4]|uniref:Uncharacterized protein n=1 Tax=Variovorax paradoxus B4 TaxID=1246301 RepID=T1XIM7_VARPD|nr:hypothetical protein [Variovorax paradoxus]AGU51975.1 hypothetical protein VAPA_1c49100 [Variovorax paradoxus B4]
MLSNLWVVIAILAIVAVAVYGWWKWFKMFNSPDGERYSRAVTQGPMVPLSPEDIEADAKRRSDRTASQSFG